MAAGLSLSFVLLGVGITAFGAAIGLDTYVIARVGAGLMVLFGLALLLPQGVAVMSTTAVHTQR